MTSINQLQTAVTAKVWQAIAQSGVDVSAMPRDDMNKLVNLVVDAALEAVDDQVAEINASAGHESDHLMGTAEDDDDEIEEILWEGRPYLSFTVYYMVTNERIRITEGLIGKNREDVELIRVQDVDHSQSITERALNIGDVHITSHDPNRPHIVLNNVRDPQTVHEIVRRAVMKARKKHRLGFREEM